MYEDLIERSRDITDLSVGKLTTYRRSGSAGGPVEVFETDQDHLNPTMVSKGTKVNRTWGHAPTGTAINPTLRYESLGSKRAKKGKACSRDMSADIAGRKVTSAMKRKWMQTRPHYRNSMIAQYISRLKYQLVITSLQVDGVPDGFPDSLDNGEKVKVWQHFNNAWPSYLQNKDKWQQEIDHNLSDFQCLVIEYVLQIGQLVNFEPVAAHCDTSNGHVIETLGLVAKVHAHEQGNPVDLGKELEERGKGQIMVPMQRHAWLIRAGRDTFHADFQNTVHLPDRQRGANNASEIQHFNCP
ncbi:expressed unknown protein [Seminavis robusta]|uniref:Uncharacterized protein n=1 Tax=Seminavis robusta TaxID=568900 RepID=A0A9N8DB83_9STRA|nr:expressed unknown protein [Seminavis robusta]|eukprot:Sro69_g038641.1  (298) ;mRNA; f:90589-91482